MLLTAERWHLRGSFSLFLGLLGLSLLSLKRCLSLALLGLSGFALRAVSHGVRLASTCRSTTHTRLSRWVVSGALGTSHSCHWLLWLHWLSIRSWHRVWHSSLTWSLRLLSLLLMLLLLRTGRVWGRSLARSLLLLGHRLLLLLRSSAVRASPLTRSLRLRSWLGSWLLLMGLHRWLRVGSHWLLWVSMGSLWLLLLRVLMSWHWLVMSRTLSPLTSPALRMLRLLLLRWLWLRWLLLLQGLVRGALRLLLQHLGHCYSNIDITAFIVV